MSKRSIKRAGVALAAVFVVVNAAGAVHAYVSALSSKDGLVKVVRVDDQFYAQDTWTDVPGTTLTVDYDEPKLMVMRFTGLASCIQNNSYGCDGQLRILVDGIAAKPSANGGYVGLVEPAPEWQGIALDRSHVAGAGQHTVKVQAKGTYQDVLSLYDYHFTVHAFTAQLVRYQG